MAKCILHAGMHKTGTTSIQNSLKDLDDSAFYYARILGQPNHSISVSAIFARASDPRLKGRRFNRGRRDIAEEIPEARRDLTRSIKAAGGRTLILSGEGMSRMTEEDLERLKTFLGRHGYDGIEVIAYIRAPAGYISSAVQQKIKAGGTQVFRLENSAPDYREKFEKFDRVFGRDKVRLFKFDPARFPDGDVVKDFCARIGLPLTSIKAVRKNESITKLAAQLRFQHAMQAEDEGLKAFRASMGGALSNRLRDLDATRFRLAPSLTRPLVESLAPDIQWMEQRLGEPLAEDLEDHPDDVHSAGDLLRPVPGINEKLRQILADDGLDVPEAAAGSTVRLVHLLAQSARQQRMDGEAAGGMGQAERRAARQERRRARKGEEAEAPRRAGGREGRRMQAAERGVRGAQAPRARKLQQDVAEEQPQAVNARFAMAEAPETVAKPRPAQRMPAPAAPGARKAGPRKAAAKAAAPAPAPALEPAEAQLMRKARSLMRKTGENPLPRTPLTMGPVPLLSTDKGLVVLWSPKSACTTTYVWFSNLMGFAEEMRDYASWPHRHRMEVFNKSQAYIDGARSGMGDARVLKIIRDPYGRAVSIYRHALQTQFANADMEAFSGGRIKAETGYSFQTFLDLVEQLDMRRSDIHFRPQFHPYEKSRTPDRVINISKNDLFTELNAFERASGYPVTDFKNLSWLHELEGKRKAKQEPLEGDTLDTFPFTRRMVAQEQRFPRYDQLLTPEARQKIERIYKADFDAYREFL